jgi:hypothetical protein
VSAVELRPELITAAAEQLRGAAETLRGGACHVGLSGTAGTGGLAAAVHRLTATESRLAVDGAARATRTADDLGSLVGRTERADRFGR